MPIAAPWARLLAGLICALLMAAAVSGCSFGHQPYREGHNASQSPSPRADFDLRFIEADDEGWFWEPAQATSTLSFVSKTAAEQDTLVVLFVHGWHHGASCCDGNLEGFKEVLSRLRRELNQPMYQAARGVQARPGGQKPISIIGIYVGWRGRSLPGLLDYATFWGRKSAAKRAGENDFQEFMVRLQQVYDGHDRQAPFLGLVSAGHSFGGAVLLAATAKHFENELQRVNPTSVFLHSTTPPAAPLQLKQPVRGFGDLVLLVNPAVEAAAYERVNLLARGLRYGEAQTPLLVTFSADNDVPRNRLFEWGRIAGEVFTSSPRLSDDRERAMRRQALGVYGKKGEQQTHRLKPVDASVQLEHAQRTAQPEDMCLPQAAQCSFDWYRWGAPPTSGEPDSLNVSDATGAQLEKIMRFDFSGELVFENLRFLPNQPQAQPYQPVIVASVDPKVIDGHNGMFSEPFLDFLVRYIGFIEAKKFLLNAPKP